VERAEFLQRAGKRSEALAALERAHLLARETEPLLPLGKRIDSLQGLLDAEGKDLTFVARFEAIRREDQTEVDLEKGKFAQYKGYPKIREALKDYGIEVAVTAPADAVARIQSRPPAVQKLVIGALEECLQSASSTGVKRPQWYLEVLQLADSDPWRREVRKAWRNVFELNRLVKDVDVGRQPANFLVLVIGALPAKSPSRLALGRRVQRAYPDDFWANQWLARDLAESGKPLEAIHYHTAAIALQPRTPGAYLNRSIAFRASGNVAEALADINRAIELAPSYAAAWQVKSQTLEAQGKPYDETIACMRKAAELGPNFALAHSCLAWLLTTCPEENLRDTAGGLEAARKAVEVAPHSALAWQVLGWAHYRTEHWKASIEALEKSCALDISPKGGNAAQWFFLAMAHWQLGEKDKAREWYYRGVEWTAKHDPRWDLLQRFRAEAAALLGLKDKQD
jgi:tetratricopeptide (TPR) repeat protein